jgi:formate-dependent nitrite reductase cytochrome c552 subunit
VHLAEGVVIRYRHADPKRQTIPWVEYTRDGKEKRVYLGAEAKPEAVEGLPMREMDCMDCHNRPSHSFESAETALDRAMAQGAISPKLPWVKKQGLELLKAGYSSAGDAERQLRARLREYYEKNHPQAFSSMRAEVDRAGQALVDIYNRNVFPEMNITWGTYPNNIGHNDFPGCFRCHDEREAQGGGKTLTQDCNACHQVLAMDEAEPKILGELGLAGK